MVFTPTRLFNAAIYDYSYPATISGWFRCSRLSKAAGKFEEKSYRGTTLGETPVSSEQSRVSVCAGAHAAASWRLRHFPACDTLPPGECEAAREFRALVAQLLSASCSMVRLSLKQLLTGNSIQGVSTVCSL